MKNGWPDKPGVPVNPEQDGWHFLDIAGDIIVAQWWAGEQLWTWGDREWTPHIAAAASWLYLGPCLTPAEHAAAIAAEREANARIAEDSAPLVAYYVDHVAYQRACEEIADVIRARGKLKENKDALS